MTQPDGNDTPAGAPRSLVSRVGLFASLTGDEADALAAELERRELPAGAAVIRQGDEGDDLFIVESGELTVTIESGPRSVRVGRLGPSDVFGEVALLRSTPRSATVTAGTPVVLWSLSRTALQRALERNERLAQQFDEQMRRRDVENALRLLQ